MFVRNYGVLPDNRLDFVGVAFQHLPVLTGNILKGPTWNTAVLMYYSFLLNAILAMLLPADLADPGEDAADLSRTSAATRLDVVDYETSEGWKYHLRLTPRFT